jgi:hypothetical protein
MRKRTYALACAIICNIIKLYERGESHEGLEQVGFATPTFMF